MIETHTAYSQNEVKNLLENHSFIKKNVWPQPKKELTLKDYQTIINKEKSTFPGKHGGILFKPDLVSRSKLDFILHAAQRAGIEHYTRKQINRKEISEVELLTNDITEDQKKTFSFYYLHFKKREKIDCAIMVSCIAIFCLIACGMKMLDENNAKTPSQPKEPIKIIQKTQPDKIKTTEHIRE